MQNKIENITEIKTVNKKLSLRLATQQAMTQRNFDAGAHDVTDARVLSDNDDMGAPNEVIGEVREEQGLKLLIGHRHDVIDGGFPCCIVQQKGEIAAVTAAQCDLAFYVVAFGNSIGRRLMNWLRGCN